MKRIDFTLQIQDETVALLQGKPVEHGMEGSKHILLNEDFLEARIWLIGTVSETEKQRIVQGVMGYLESLVNAAYGIQANVATT